MVEVGVARPGYELWRPNREKAQSKTAKTVVAFVLIVSACLLVIVTIGGWERLASTTMGLLTIAWAGLYVLFALLVLNWNRGVLPVASALAVLMAIFASVAAPGWFERAKDGLDSPLLPEELLGLLTVVVIAVQLLLVAIAMIAFNQEWQVEEERPIGGGALEQSAPVDEHGAPYGVEAPGPEDTDAPPAGPHPPS
jgi:lysylphosphatidylglycerol synthetase-like protein (DUF2156 family)